ncbi:hypothetical protein [Halonotius aquaticus]|uniref:hypothetical protein n=1 Tax=Halonotius aquaticus TaxID=2216978 RepID=UPI001403E8A4|nr:hypothetical protein [Halonotius aquaticus]
MEALPEDSEPAVSVPNLGNQAVQDEEYQYSNPILVILTECGKSAGYYNCLFAI